MRYIAFIIIVLSIFFISLYVIKLRKNLKRQIVEKENDLLKKNEELLQKEKEKNIAIEKIKTEYNKKVVEDNTKYLKRKEEVLEQMNLIISKENKLEEKKANYEQEKIDFLYKATNMNKQESVDMLLNEIEKYYQADVVKVINKYKNELKIKKKELSQNMLLTTMENIASDISEANTYYKIFLNDDNDKGRLIGREGRNLKTIENTLGVNLIIDENPDFVTITSFDPIRREIAKRTLDNLVESGKINQIMIEEEAEKQTDLVDDIIWQKGKEAIEELEIYDIHDELVIGLGKLYFRSSYSQNVLDHSKEVARICKYIAGLFNLDQNLATRCGLLHDIGKVDSMQTSKPHDVLGYQIVQMYLEPIEVQKAVRDHHIDDIDDIYTIIVKIADKISASKIGARKESMDKFIERISEIETVASSVSGVTKAYALKGGREIRVIVNSNQIDDKQLAIIADQVKRNIESSIHFPGIIKVNALREVRISREAIKTNEGVFNEFETEN